MKNLIKNIKENYKLLLGVLILGMFLGWIFFHQSAETKSTEIQTEAELHNHADETGTIWTCSMHPQIKMDKPGKCPICSMDLIPLTTNSNSDDEQIDPSAIVISESAARLAEIETLEVV